jgi:hypothetical protein
MRPLLRRYANKGAPTREVRIPRGISVAAIVLDRSSTSSINEAPMTILMGRRRL